MGGVAQALITLAQQVCGPALKPPGQQKKKKKKKRAEYVS
jgi:hypothetical protein